MPKIRILPEQLANQIAAGEVVERPASVVKELLENSLDAGADRIEIEIEGGGTRLIRVIDNGEGMVEDDVLLSLERHGTSKIQSDKDLTAINTLGFRGEAIPSIGSVSHMTITSRPATAELGTRAVLKYGKLIKVHEIGCSAGTTFEIKNLFGNTPARRKFLRTNRTELSHIEEVVKNYGLASWHVTFILTVNNRQSIYLDSNGSLEQRLGQIIRYTGDFIKVGDPSATHPQRRLFGYLVPPERLSAGPAKLRLFVNGRAIKDRMLSHGVAEGLRGFLMKNKSPAGLIHLQLPADEVDVNVHPAKHEVRFRHSRDVHFLLTNTIAQAMREAQRTLQRSMFGANHQASPTAVPLDGDLSAEDALSARHEVDIPAHTKEMSLVDRTKNETGQASPSLTNLTDSVKDTPAVQRALPAEPLVAAEPAPAPPALQDRPTDTRPTQQGVAPTAAQTGDHGLQIIGQYDDLYIFCSNSEGLLVIDQHAAHERLLYEELRRQFLDKKVAKQNLLFPESVELTVFQAQLVEQHQEELEQMGFSLRDFGGNTYIIAAIPALAGQCSAVDLLHDALQQFGSEDRQSGSEGGKIDTILATMACRAAVKAGTQLSRQEIEALLQRMAQADLFSHCPHGRPVVKQFRKNEVKKWFYRS